MIESLWELLQVRVEIVSELIFDAARDGRHDAPLEENKHACHQCDGDERAAIGEQLGARDVERQVVNRMSQHDWSDRHTDVRQQNTRDAEREFSPMPGDITPQSPARCDNTHTVLPNPRCFPDASPT
jgi:hypothetical protein